MRFKKKRASLKARLALFCIILNSLSQSAVNVSSSMPPAK
jgi:hypothetical protein